MSTTKNHEPTSVVHCVDDTGDHTGLVTYPTESRNQAEAFQGHLSQILVGQLKSRI